MKTINKKVVIRNILLTITTALMIFSFASCAKKATFLTSSVVPAARGVVKIKKDKNNNYLIRIELGNLAESSRLTPPKKTYVVWLVSDNNLTKNIGQLKSSTSVLSKKLKASFESVSPLKPTKIFITAEYDGAVQYPDSQVVLSTDYF